MSLGVGTVFAGEWRVLSRLAEGGMGTVYRVEQCSTGQQRALKVLRAMLWEDPRARDRFEQEAQVVSKIASEHITKVIAAGIDPDEGAPWIAMELLEGETLKKRVERQGPYGRIEALELARQLCHALSAAHDAGVVHRDLKPENIFVARSSRVGAPEMIKLLDFGIATALEEFETSATVTSVVGSPLWMAPEQVRRERIKPATDVWALGLLMFWALTGKPYWRKTFPADAVLFEKMVEPLVLASQRADELGCADSVPPGFDPWFARCVARKIDERFRDATEAFDAFERIMTDPRMPRGLPPSRGRVSAIVALTALGAGAIAWVARPYLSPLPSAELPPMRIVLAGALDGAATDASDALADRISPADSATDSRNTLTMADASAADARTVTHSRGALVAPDASPLRVAINNTTTLLGRAANSVSSVSSAGGTAVLTPTAPGAAPMLAGFTVRRYVAAQSACAQRGATRPWQVIPDWYLQRRNEMHLDERGRRLAAERSMAARITDETARRTAAESVATQEANLERDRQMLESEVQRSLASLRSALAQRARDAHCTEAGLRADSEALFATWCCR